MLVQPAILGSLKPLGSPPQGFPGQPGNPVGFAAAPGFSSLTPFSGTLTTGTSGLHQVYSFKDFNSGNFPNVTLGSGLQFVDFIGCRFQSNANSAHPAATSSSNVLCNGAKNITFSYCSWTPLASKYPRPPNYGLTTTAWPASGALHNVVTQVGGIGTNALANAVIETDAYTYGFLFNTTNSGPITFSHCDFWGYGNIAIDWGAATTAAVLVDNCWIHDNAAVGNTNQEHLDALGYLDGFDSTPSNITISNCTIACIGNDGSGDGLAWQGGATSAARFNNINHIGNYISGYGYSIILSEPDTGIFTNSQFVNNIFGTDCQSFWGMIFQDFGIEPPFVDYGPMFSANGNTWSGNKIHVVAGTTAHTDATPSFTLADDGKFLWPDSTLHVTDF